MLKETIATIPEYIIGLKSGCDTNCRCDDTSSLSVVVVVVVAVASVVVVIVVDIILRQDN